MKKSRFLKLLTRLLAYRPWIFILSLFCNILIFGYSAATAYFIREILNTVEYGIAGNSDVLLIIKPILYAIIGIALVRVVAITVCAVLDNVQSFYYDNLLRNNIMRIIYKKPNIKNIVGKSERTYEILDDDVPICAFPAQLLSEVSGYVVYSLIAIASLLIINWRVTVYIFIPLSIGIMIIQRASSKLKGNRKANREIHEKVSETISDTVNLVQTIKITGSEESVLKNYDKLNSKRLNTVMRDILFDSSLQAILGGTVYIGTAIMMFIVAKSMMKGQFPIGDFSMFVCYLGTLADCVDRIMELVTEGKKAEVSYDRIVELLESENEKELTRFKDLRAFKEMDMFEYEGMKKTSLEELEVKNLTYSHDDRNGIYDVSFRLKPGEILALAGGVGCGKSTVLNVLMGIVPKDSGRVLWNGVEIAEQKEFFVPPNTAYIAQIPKLFNTTVYENLTLGRPTKDGEIKKALHRAVFEDDIAEMEMGLNTQAGSRGNMLSGGQKQRLGMARMFLHDAEVYLMDDSTSAIDPETEAEFWKRFEEDIRERKFACIIATNKKHILERADKVIYLENGHMV